MIYKAVEVIWIFGAESGEAGIEGTLGGPRGPKKVQNKNCGVQLLPQDEMFCNSMLDCFMFY